MTTKDYAIGALPLPRQLPKHPTSGCTGIITEMKREWCPVKIKLDDINYRKPKIANNSTSKKKNEAKVYLNMGVEITAVKRQKKL